MSKDKGSKNHKKAPADRSAGKIKATSAYKSEGKSELDKNHSLDVFLPKADPKKSKGKKD
jgi:hypothetical protein